MASGSFTGTNNGQCQCKISWSSSKGTGGSTVNANLIAQNINGYYFYATVYYGYSLSINGNSKSGSGGSLSKTANGAVTLLSHSVWVGYTGNKSITISGSINLTGILNGGTISCSGTAALDKVGSAPTTPTVTAPTTQIISETSSTITVSWNASTSYSNTGNYILQVSINSGSWSNVSTTIGWGSRSYSYSISNKAQSTKYQFRVAAKNDIGTSGYSTSGTVTINSLSPPTIGTLATFNPYVNSNLSVPLSGGSQANGGGFTRRANVHVDGNYKYAGNAPSANGNTSVTIPLSAANILSDLGKNSYSSSTRFTVVAWTENSNGTRSSYVSKTFTVNINSDGGATPTLEAPTLSGGALGATTTCFISGVSTVNVSSPAAILRRAPSGTTVSYTIECTGASSVSGQTASYSGLSAGTKTIKVTATDSRGLSVSATKQFIVQSWSAPKISITSCDRISDATTSVKLVYSVSYTPIYTYSSITVQGAQLNDISVQQYNINNGEWINATNNMTITDLSTELNYIVYMRCADKVKTTTYSTDNALIPTIKSLFSMRKWGIGVGCIPQNGNALEITGKSVFNGDMSITNNAKSTTSDGKTGVIVGGNGIIELSASSPYIDFHQGNSTTDYTYRIIGSSTGFNFYSNTGIHWFTGANAAKHAWIDSNGHMSVQGNITATGTISSTKGIYVQKVTAGSGSTGYVLVAEIKIKSSYMNSPIVFEVSRRGQPEPTQVYIMFANDSGTDPDLSYGYIKGAAGIKGGVYLHKKTTGTWDLYFSKNESYDAIGVINVKYDHGYMDSGIDITYPATFVSSLPSGYTQLTLHNYDIFPVGAVYISTTSTNPSTYFGGTWVQFGQGRTLIGAGTGNDGSTSMSFTAMATGGKYHPKPRAAIGAVNSDVGAIGYAAASPISGRSYTYAISGSTRSISRINHSTLVKNEDGTEPTTIQPYIVTYFWRRTA